MFRDYLQTFCEKNIRRALIDLFKVLNTPPTESRNPYMEDNLVAFPYVNGGLFDDGNIEIPKLTTKIVDLLIRQVSEDFDWSGTSPTIFGAVLIRSHAAQAVYTILHRKIFINSSIRFSMSL